MLLKIVQFVAFEGVVFFAMVIGSIALSHLGLMLLGRIDAHLWRDRSSRVANARFGEAGNECVGEAIPPGGEAK